MPGTFSEVMRPKQGRNTHQAFAYRRWPWISWLSTNAGIRSNAREPTSSHRDSNAREASLLHAQNNACTLVSIAHDLALLAESLVAFIDVIEHRRTHHTCDLLRGTSGDRRDATSP